MARARRADIILRTETRKNRRDLQRAKKDYQAFARDTRKSLAGAFKGGFANVAAFGTAGGLAAIGKEVFEFEESLARLDIQAKGTANIDAIRAAAGRLSVELGISRNEALKAATALTDRLGGAAATAENLEVLAKAHVATGAEMEDLALLALKLDKAFGLRSPQEMSEGLSALIEVGKQGSVPLKEMAAVIAQSGSQFARFGGEGKRAAAEIGALIQVAVAGGKAGGFGSAAEAGTGLRAFITQLDQSEAALAAMGIKVKTVGEDGQRVFLPMADILDQITKKNLVNKRVFPQVFGSATARDFLAVLLDQREAFEDLTAAGVASNATQEDSAKFLQTRAGQMKKAWQGLRAEVEKLFTPERVDAMIKAANLLGRALGFVVDHWKIFLALLVATKAVQLGSTLTKWATSARQLALNASEAASGLGKVKAAGAVALPGAPVAGPAGKAGALAKGAVALPALGVGFAAGQALGEGIMARRRSALAKRTAAEKARLSDAERVAKAFQDLEAAGAITEEGRVSGDVQRSLARARIEGRELSPVEQAASIALGGFERQLTERQQIQRAMGRTVAPERFAISGEQSQFGLMIATLLEASRGATTDQQASRAEDERKRLEMDERLLAAIEALGTRPVEVRMENDVVARGYEQAPDNRRRPAP